MENQDKCGTVDGLLKGFENCFFQYQMAVFENVEPFKKLLFEDPNKALKQITKVYSDIQDQAYTDKDGTRISKAYIPGGPHESTTWPLYNAIGSIYPLLPREQKDEALQQLFSIFDTINYMYVNGAYSTGDTPGIREPLLLADISLARPIYWPGMDEGRFLLKKYDDFDSLRTDLINENGMFNEGRVNSDFLVGYSLLRSDFCDFGGEYVKIAEPLFLDRILQAVVATRVGNPESNAEKGMARLKELLPQSVHDRLEPLREQGGWVDVSKFP